MAERLNRTIGGYGPAAEESVNHTKEAEPEIKVEPIEAPPMQPKGPSPENGGKAGSSKWASSSGISIYDAPAITRESMSVANAAPSAPKPKRAKKPKQRHMAKEPVAATAT